MFRIALVLTATLLFTASAYAQQVCPSGNPRNAPDSRYHVQADGTVRDLQTSLIWQRCSQGQAGTSCSGTASTPTWAQALVLASNSSFAGQSDWRLPSSKELQTLPECGCNNPRDSTGQSRSAAALDCCTGRTAGRRHWAVNICIELGTQAPKRQKVRSRGRIEVNGGRSSKPPAGCNARAQHGRPSPLGDVPSKPRLTTDSSCAGLKRGNVLRLVRGFKLTRAARS